MSWDYFRNFWTPKNALLSWAKSPKLNSSNARWPPLPIVAKRLVLDLATRVFENMYVCEIVWRSVLTSQNLADSSNGCWHHLNIQTLEIAVYGHVDQWQCNSQGPDTDRCAESHNCSSSSRNVKLQEPFIPEWWSPVRLSLLLYKMHKVQRVSMRFLIDSPWLLPPDLPLNDVNKPNQWPELMPGTDTLLPESLPIIDCFTKSASRLKVRPVGDARETMRHRQGHCGSWNSVRHFGRYTLRPQLMLARRQQNRVVVIGYN